MKNFKYLLAVLVLINIATMIAQNVLYLKDNSVSNYQQCPGDCYQLTNYTAVGTSYANSGHYTKKISLKTKMVLEFDANFGENEIPGFLYRGADGICVVFHKNYINSNYIAASQVIGKGGGDLGISDTPLRTQKITNSLAVKFDTYPNNYHLLTNLPPLPDDYDEPSEDHVSFVKNGNMLDQLDAICATTNFVQSNHTFTYPYASRTYNLWAALLPDLETGTCQKIKIIYDPETVPTDPTLEVYLEINGISQLICTLHKNLATFLGYGANDPDPKCWLAFTSATAIYANNQSVCNINVANKFNLNTIQNVNICDGSTVKLKLFTNMPSNTTYSWTADGVPMTTSSNEPDVSPSQTTVYVVTATNNGDIYTAKCTVFVDYQIDPEYPKNYIKSFNTQTINNGVVSKYFNIIGVGDVIKGGAGMPDCHFLFGGTGFRAEISTEYNLHVLNSFNEVIKTDFAGNKVFAKQYTQSVSANQKPDHHYNKTYQIKDMGFRTNLSNSQSVNINNGYLLLGTYDIMNNYSQESTQIITLNTDGSVKGSLFSDPKLLVSDNYPGATIIGSDNSIIGTISGYKSNYFYNNLPKSEIYKIKDKEGDPFDFKDNNNLRITANVLFQFRGFIDINSNSLEILDIQELEENKYIVLGRYYTVPSDTNSNSLVLIRLNYVNGNSAPTKSWAYEYKVGSQNLSKAKIVKHKYPGESDYSILVLANRQLLSNLETEIFAFEINSYDGEIKNRKNRFYKTGTNANFFGNDIIKDITINNNYIKLIGYEAFQCDNNQNCNLSNGKVYEMLIDINNLSLFKSFEIKSHNSMPLYYSATVPFNNISNFKNSSGNVVFGNKEYNGSLNPNIETQDLFEKCGYIVEKNNNSNEHCYSDYPVLMDANFVVNKIPVTYNFISTLSENQAIEDHFVSYINLVDHEIYSRDVELTSVTECIGSNVACECSEDRFKITAENLTSTNPLECCYKLSFSFTSARPTCAYKKMIIKDANNVQIGTTTIFTTPLNLLDQSLEICLPIFENTKTYKLVFLDGNDAQVCEQNIELKCACSCDNQNKLKVTYIKESSTPECCYSAYLELANSQGMVDNCIFSNATAELDVTNGFTFTGSNDFDVTTTGSIKTIKPKKTMKKGDRIKIGKVCGTQSQQLSMTTKTNPTCTPETSNLTFDCNLNCCDAIVISPIISASSSNPNECCFTFSITSSDELCRQNTFSFVIKDKYGKIVKTITGTNLNNPANVSLCLSKLDIVKNSPMLDIEVSINGELKCVKKITLPTCVSCCDYFDIKLVKNGCQAKAYVNQLGATNCASSIRLKWKYASNFSGVIQTIPINSNSLLSFSGDLFVPSSANIPLPNPNVQSTLCFDYTVEILDVNGAVLCSKTINVCCQYGGSNGCPECNPVLGP